MDLLPVHFRTFQLFGLWYNDPRSHRLAKLVHRSVVVLLIVHLSLFQMLALFSAKRSVDEYTNTLFLAMTYFVHIYKMFVFMAKSRSVNEMLDEFRSDICRTRGPEEESIFAKHVKRANWIYGARMILTLLCGSIRCVIPILIGLSTGKIDQLPFDTYFFNVSDSIQFALVYILQTLAVIAAIATDVCLDSTPCACMILAYAQLEICCYRIRCDNSNIKAVDDDLDIAEVCIREYKEENSFKEYARHHMSIQKIVQRIQSAFISIVLPIFCSALLTLCTSIFQLAQKNHDFVEYCFITLYLCCLLLQIYCFCWFGNELQLKGELVSDAIYQTNWTTIKPRTRKNYWYIMFMGRNKLVISFHGQCALTLQTFIWMIKTSYGAFNLLKQVSDSE